MKYTLRYTRGKKVYETIVDMSEFIEEKGKEPCRYDIAKTGNIKNKDAGRYWRTQPCELEK